MKVRERLPAILGFVLVVGAAATGVAALGGSGGVQIPYLGHLDEGGAPAEGSVDLEFRLFDQATGGTECSQRFARPATTLLAGDFATVIGPVPESCVKDKDVFLEVVVGPGASEAVLGRQRIFPAVAAVTSGAGDFHVRGELATASLRSAGGLTATTGAFGGLVTAPAVTLTGLLSANSATVTGALTANSAGLQALTTGAATVNGAATVTGNLGVGGTTGVGYTRKTCAFTAGADFTDCSCDGGARVISGGTFVAGVTQQTVLSITVRTTAALRESRPLNDSTWRAACTSTMTLTVSGSSSNTTTIANADCGAIDIICARVGP